MLTLFQTLTRLAFLNHDMRVASVARGHKGRKHISVQRAITLIKHSTQFCTTPRWWIRLSRYIRISFDLSGLGRMKLRLGVITWKPSAISCKKNVRVMKT